LHENFILSKIFVKISAEAIVIAEHLLQPPGYQHLWKIVQVKRKKDDLHQTIDASFPRIENIVVWNKASYIDQVSKNKRQRVYCKAKLGGEIELDFYLVEDLSLLEYE